jgi:hypothetical protein
MHEAEETSVELPVQVRLTRTVVNEEGCRPVAGLVGIEGGVVSGVINFESSGIEAPERRPRHDERYPEA